MSAAGPDPAPVREYFDAFGRGDFDGVRAVFADDCVITVPGAGLLAGRYDGQAGLDRFLETVLTNVDGRRSGFRVDDLMVGRQFVVVRELAELVRSGTDGEPVELPLLLRFTVGADGRIARLDITPEDAGRYDSFWGARPATQR